MSFIIKINKGIDKHSDINAGILMHSISIILTFCGSNNHMKIEDIYVHVKCNRISTILFRKLVLLFLYKIISTIIKPII